MPLNHDEPLRVLVAGGTGMLGHACVTAFAGRFELAATVRDPTSAAAASLGVALHPFDVWTGSAEELLADTKPDIVVNCIGLVKQLPEAQRPRAAVRVNALLPHELAEACEESGVRLIHISTDCVFSGELPLGQRYQETHSPDPVDLYGASKLLGEVSAPHLTIRTSIIGPELQRESGLLEWFRAQNGNAVSGYTRAVFSGVTTATLARLLAELIEEHADLAGLYHVAAEPIAKYDLLVALREVLELNCEINPVDEPTVNRALDPGRFMVATGLSLPSWPEMLHVYRSEVADRRLT